MSCAEGLAVWLHIVHHPSHYTHKLHPLRPRKLSHNTGGAGAQERSSWQQNTPRKARLFKLQNQKPTCVSVVSKSGRKAEGCGSERHRAAGAGLSTAQQQPPQKKNKRRRRRRRKFKKRQRETAGSQESTERPGNSSQLGDAAKRGGAALCYWKSWQDSEAAGRAGTEVAALTLTWSVKASCSFLPAAQTHFYPPDTSIRSRAHREPRTEGK